MYDQAHKFISMNAATVAHAKISGRVPIVYVLTAMVAATTDFEFECDAKQTANVLRGNKLGDVDIHSVINSGKALTSVQRSSTQIKPT